MYQEQKTIEQKKNKNEINNMVKQDNTMPQDAAPESEPLKINVWGARVHNL